MKFVVLFFLSFFHLLLSTISAQQPFLKLGQFDPVFGIYDSEDSKRYDGSLDVRLNAGFYIASHQRFLYQFDLLLPFYRLPNTLVYGDFIVINPTGKSLQLSTGLGFRHIKDKSMWGSFLFFDRLKSPTGNFFDQFVLGSSLLLNHWGFNLIAFFPFHKTSQFATAHHKTADYYKNILVRNTQEKILPGLEIEANYGFLTHQALRIYLGGYYFKRKAMPTIAGPKLRLTYRIDSALKNKLRIIDYMTLEAMIRYDKPRGTDCYIGVNFTIPLGGKSKRHEHGLDRYMNSAVRYDIN